MGVFFKESFEKYPGVALGFVCFGVFLWLLRFFYFQYFENKRMKFQMVDLINNIMEFNIDRASKKQKLVAEMAFFKVFGKKITFFEIKALLNYGSPIKAIELFVKGKDFLKISNSGKSFILKKDYIDIRVFGFHIFYLRDVMYYGLYNLFIIFSIFPMNFMYTVYQGNRWFKEEYLGMFNIFWFSFSGVLVAFLYYYAMLNIVKAQRLRSAFKFVENNELVPEKLSSLR